MASTCFDSEIDIFIAEPQDSLFNVPIENRCGDIPFVPMKIEVVSLTKTADSIIPEALMIGLSCGFVVILATAAWSEWKVLMSYIPLYLCLIPVFYWILKIAAAFVYAKTYHLHSQSDALRETVSQKHDEPSPFESLLVNLINISSRLLEAFTKKRPH